MMTAQYQGQGFHNDVAYCDNYHQGSLDLGATVLVQQQHLHVLNKNQRIPPCLSSKLVLLVLLLFQCKNCHCSRF